MTTTSSYRNRRTDLAKKIPNDVILLMGHSELPRNYIANPLPFRQDSTFLYFTGCHTPGAACILWPSGQTTLYLPEIQLADELWHGRQTPVPFIARRAGAEHVSTPEQLGKDIAALVLKGTTLHTLPVANPLDNAKLAHLTGLPLNPAQPESGSKVLLEAIIGLRMKRDQDEIASMRQAADVTARAHRVAMAATQVGTVDYEIQALIEAVFRSAGMESAYPPIVTVEGEVLHGHASGREFKDGQLLLVDAGAESKDGYATDVTRTWPVNGRFEGFQKSAYQAVLTAQKAAISKCKPGVEFRDIHLAASAVIVKFLVDQLLLEGDVQELLERGAHAPFFPHGVGHLLGLDVHDMELFGDHAGYAPERRRSEQFGLSFLRLDRKLEAGMVVTIEPGFYIIPSILRDPSLRDTFSDTVKWEEAHRLAPFGGIRIEDDVLITEEGYEVLTDSIPKEIKDIESLIGTGLKASERLT